MTYMVEVALLSIWDVRIGVSMAIVGGYQAMWAVLIGSSSSIAVVLPAAGLFRRAFRWMKYRLPRYRDFLIHITRRHHVTIDRWGYWGIFFIVAIPLPGTGPWTGALCAAVLQLEPVRASLALAGGIILAGLFSAGIVEGFLSLLPLIS